MELWQQVEKLKEAYEDFLLGYMWEWFCTFSIQGQGRVDISIAQDILKKLRILAREHKILIAYMGVFNTVPQPHIHLLALGKRNKFGQTLLDLDPKRWERDWSDWKKWKAVDERFRLPRSEMFIEPIYDRKGIASYIAQKNLPWAKSEPIDPCNKRLLEKAIIR